MSRLRLVIVFILVTLALGSAHAGEPQDGPVLPGEHALQWAAHRHEAPAPLGLWATSDRDVTYALDYVVYGYLPYWEFDYTFPRWDLLSHVSYFSVNLEADGSFGSTHGWCDDFCQDLRDEAHANGVAFTLTITCFDDAAIHGVVSTAATRQKVIDALVETIDLYDADGVNIDFEGMSSTDKADFVTFITDLTDAMHMALPGSHITLATPKIDWNGAFDYDLLMDGSDGLMIMAYGYHWQGGDPGPVAPLTTGSPWGQYCLEWTLGDYDTYGNGDRKKIIMGLPFYGRDWPSASPDKGADALADSSYVPYYDSFTEAGTYGSMWDTASQTPWYVYQSGSTWHQVWYDDEQSFTLKAEWIAQEGLAGIGIWALGYDAELPGYWNGIETHLASPVDPVTPEPSPETAEEVVDYVDTVQEVIDEVGAPDTSTAPDTVPSVDTMPSVDTTPAVDTVGLDQGPGADTTGATPPTKECPDVTCECDDGCAATPWSTGAPMTGLLVLLVTLGLVVVRRS